LLITLFLCIKVKFIVSAGYNDWTHILILCLAILLFSCSQLASQIFLPALPHIAQSLGMQQWESQLIVSGYLCCLGISQLVVGPLRDKYGDRWVFFIGQTIFILGTFCCAVANSVWWFSIGRVLQGIGAAAPLLISRTLLATNMRGQKLKSAIVSLSMAASVVAIFIPFLGGWLSEVFNWRILAASLAVYFLMVALLGWLVLPQVPVESCGEAYAVKQIFTQYLKFLTNIKFTALGMFKWIPTFLYLTTQLFFPFELQRNFNLSEQQFGQLMMLPISGLLLGSLLVELLQRRLSAPVILALFWPLFVVSGLCYWLLPASLTFNLVAYGLLMVVFGAYFPIYIQTLSQLFLKRVGTANALAGALDLLLFTLLAVLCNAYLLNSVADLAWISIGAALCLCPAWIILFGSSRLLSLKQRVWVLLKN